MRTTGFVSEINKDIVTVKALETGSGCAGCSTGGCASCGTDSGDSGRTYKARNSENFPLEINSVVEISLPVKKAFTALVRVIFMPSALFAVFYILVPFIFKAGEGAQIAGGFSGLLLGWGINFLMRDRIKEKEMPAVTKLYS